MNMEKTNLVAFVKSCWPNYPIKSENVEKPTVQFVKNFCMHFLDDFDKTLFEMANFPEIFPENVSLQRESCAWNDDIFLYVRMKEILENIKVGFFTLADIYNPVKKRFQAIVTVSISLLLRMHSIVKDGQKITGDVWQVLRNKMREKQEAEDLKASINDMAIKKVKVDKKIEALQSELNILKDKHKNLKRTEEEEAEFNKKKQMINRLKNNCQKCQEAIENLIIENKPLEENIVDSAEIKTLQQECANLREKIETKSEYAEEYHKTLLEKRKTLHHFTELEQIANNIDHVEHHKIAKELTDCQSQISTLNQNLCKLNTQIKNMDIEKLALNENICLKEETLQSMQVQFLSLKNSQQKEIALMKLEHENTVREKEEKHCLAEKYIGKLHELEADCTASKSEISEFTEAVAEEYRLLLEKEKYLTTHFHKCLNELSKNEQRG